MKKIKHYEDSSFDFHYNVVESKHGDNFAAVYAISVEDDIKRAFKDYDDRFDADDLHGLSPILTADPNKPHLQDLYDYSATPFRELRRDLTTDDYGRKYPYCPLCTITPSDTLDHIVPQSKFEEFSDHPLNLIPSCSDCNRRKNAEWLDAKGKRKYLNLYIDDLPTDKRYLFVDFKWTRAGRAPVVKFSVANPDGIDAELFGRIWNHYDKLKLCDRFSEVSDTKIGELHDTLYDDLERPEEEIREKIQATAKRLGERNGFNYWVKRLYEAIAADAAMLRYLIDYPA